MSAGGWVQAPRRETAVWSRAVTNLFSLDPIVNLTGPMLHSQVPSLGILSTHNNSANPRVSIRQTNSKTQKGMGDAFGTSPLEGP